MKESNILFRSNEDVCRRFMMKLKKMLSYLDLHNMNNFKKEPLLKFSFNLQLFAEESGEKTEKATPKKKQDSRKKGQTFKSTEIVSAFLILTCITCLYLTYPYIYDTMAGFTFEYFSFSQEVSVNSITELSIDIISVILAVCFPIFLVSFITSAVSNYIQVGFLFTGEPLKPKLDRINPLSGFKRIFSKRAAVEFAKSILKVSIIGYIVYHVINKYVHLFIRLIDTELSAAINLFAKVAFEMGMKVGLCLIVIGVLDYIYQWWEYETSLKMTKHEVKEEHKQTEGDPLIKSKQKQIQRQISMRRMMAEVPNADVIITNPTHFAIAIKYDDKSMHAPLVVAKGQDYLALRIKDIAIKNHIIIVENKVLARTLYYNVNIDEFIPEEFYQSIAEVLVFVYQQRGQL